MSVLTHWIERKWPSFSRRHFQMHFLVSKLWIPNKIPLKFVPKGPINNVPALVQIISWHRPGDKPLSEPMMVSLLMHICVTRPQWVNTEFILIPESSIEWRYCTFKLDILWVTGRHDMEMFSTLLDICEGNPEVTVRFSHKGPVLQSFYVFFVVILKKLLNELSNCLCLETPWISYDVPVRIFLRTILQCYMVAAPCHQNSQVSEMTSVNFIKGILGHKEFDYKKSLKKCYTLIRLIIGGHLYDMMQSWAPQLIFSRYFVFDALVKLSSAARSSHNKCWYNWWIFIDPNVELCHQRHTHSEGIIDFTIDLFSELCNMQA